MTNKASVKIDYTLEFVSAFHLGTGLRNGLIDRAIARSRDGYLYVPGSTIKGVVRHRCEQIASLFGLEANDPHTEMSLRKEANTQDPDIITRIFGSRFLPSTLFFDDASLSKEDRALFDGDTPATVGKYKARQVEERTQVSLSRRVRTAKQGHLYTSEYGIRSLRFSGKIYGFLAGQSIMGELQSYSLVLLLAGLKSLDRIGANKSTGAGDVICHVTDSIEYGGETMSAQSVLEEYLSFLELYKETRRQAE